MDEREGRSQEAIMYDVEEHWRLGLASCDGQLETSGGEFG